MSLIFFIFARAYLKDCIVRYVGDGRNVITRAKHRRSGNRVSKYSARIQNRIGNDCGLTVSPLYISALGNKIKDEIPPPLPRLPNAEAIQYGIGLGLRYVDSEPIANTYFEDRLRVFSIVHPADNTGRVRTTMQYVEKRGVRYIPSHVMCNIHIFPSVWALTGGGISGNTHDWNPPYGTYSIGHRSVL